MSVPLTAAAPGRQELVLETEHLLVLLRLGVVVAEQVQDAVHGQQLDLGLGAVARGLALLGGDVGAQHQVAEHALLGLLVDQAGAQLVHRERQHVGRSLLVHPLLVELGDGRLVDGLDAQLGQRVHAHPVHHEAAEGGQLVDVELAAGLVEDLDRHRGPRGVVSGGSEAEGARNFVG